MNSLDTVLGIENFPSAMALHELVVDEKGTPIDYVFISANQHFHEHTGLNFDDIVGRRATEVLPGIEETPFIRDYGKVVLTGEPLVVEQFSAVLDRHYSITAFKVGAMRFATMFADITDKKLTEELLKKNEAQLREAQAIASVGSWEYDSDTDSLRWSDETHRIFGTTKGGFEETYESFLSMVHPDDLQQVKELYSRSIEYPHVDYEIEHRLIRRDNGEQRHVYEKCRHERDATGRVVRSLGIVNDITDIRRAEAERARLFAAIEQTDDAIVLTLPNGDIQYVNRSFERMTGYSRYEAIGSNPRILKSGEQDDCYYAQMWETITSGLVWKGRFINRRKDGSLYTEDASISPVFDEFGKISCFVAAKKDVTERISKEAQLQQAQKMETLGRLSSGVAHDFNNVLQIMLGCAEMQLEDGNVDSETSAALEQIKDVALQAAGITRQLLIFARNNVSQSEMVNPNSNIPRLLKMLRRMIGPRIEIEWEPGDLSRPILIDTSNLDQVVANLCINAADAIADSGRIVISTSQIALQNAKDVVSGDTLSPGQYVRIAVHDNGHGMKQSILERIFEPFFTTKEAGKGTGLGLSIVYGIVKQNNGGIDVLTELDNGTTFEIYIPACETRQAVMKAPTDSATGITHTGKTIMLVDDNTELLRQLKKVLELSGSKVHAAQSAEEAIALAEQHNRSIDLTISDIQMPKMNGFDLIRQLRESHPYMKFMIISGFSPDEKMIEKTVGTENYLQKPFPVKNFRSKVQEILASA